MVMKSAEQWHCTNPACRCEVLVQTASEMEGSNPRCVCGFPMKKRYAAPHFTYLDFLRIDEALHAPERSHKV